MLSIKNFAKKIYDKVSPAQNLSSFPGPVFILGTMRSGTTYLTQMLSSHPQVIKIDNVAEPFHYIGKIDLDCQCPHLTENYLPQVDVPGLIYNLTLQLAYQEKFKSSSGEIVALLKNNHLLNKTKLLRALFPNVKFILIIRDIHSHIFSLEKHFCRQFKNNGLEYLPPSNKKSCFQTRKVAPANSIPSIIKENYQSLPETYINLLSLALEELEQSSRGQFIVVDNTKLIQNFSQEVRRIFDFLELAHTNILPGKLINNYNTDPLNDWKTKMDKEHIETVDACIKENMRNYEKIVAAVTY